MAGAGGAGFEYMELVEHFCLDEDEALRSTDLPERYQLLMKGREPPSDEERRSEARWIAIQLAERMLVQEVLAMLQRDGLEVPYIFQYKKDYLHARMTRDDLWAVVSLDEAWEALYSLKFKMHRYAQLIYQVAEASEAQEEAQEDQAVAQLDEKTRQLYLQAARLFPKDRYFLLTEDVYDEPALRAVLHFLRTLLLSPAAVRSEYHKLKTQRAVRVLAEALSHPAHAIGRALGEGEGA
eukprot:gene45252-55361_t